MTDDSDRHDRDAILARRRRFVAAALGGLTTSTLATACPCLDVAGPMPPETETEGETQGETDNATGATGATGATQGSASESTSDAAATDAASSSGTADSGSSGAAATPDDSTPPR